MKVTIEVEVDWNKFVSELGVIGQSCSEDVVDSIEGLVNSGLPIASQNWVKDTQVTYNRYK